MFHGIRTFFKALSEILHTPELLRWWKKTILKSFAVALLILLATLAIGLGLIRSWGTDWYFEAGAVLWVFALIYFSGALTLALTGVTISFFADEEFLMQKLFHAPNQKLARSSLKALPKEWWASARTLGVAALSFPFFLFPFSIPLGILLLAWAVGQETLAAGQRLNRQFFSFTHLPEQKKLTPQQLSHRHAMGIGLLPALCTLLPLLSIILWPVSLVAGILSTRSADN